MQKNFIRQKNIYIIYTHTHTRTRDASTAYLPVDRDIKYKKGKKTADLFIFSKIDCLADRQTCTQAARQFSVMSKLARDRQTDRHKQLREKEGRGSGPSLERLCAAP